jgi:hypothetical protein
MQFNSDKPQHETQATKYYRWNTSSIVTEKLGYLILQNKLGFNVKKSTLL